MKRRREKGRRKTLVCTNLKQTSTKCGEALQKRHILSSEAYFTFNMRDCSHYEMRENNGISLSNTYTPKHNSKNPS